MVGVLRVKEGRGLRGGREGDCDCEVTEALPVNGLCTRRLALDLQAGGTARRRGKARRAGSGAELQRTQAVAGKVGGA